MPIINLLLPDQLKALRALEATLAAAPDFETACGVLATRVSGIVDAPVALLAERQARWRVAATSGTIPAAAVLRAVRSAAASVSTPMPPVADLVVEREHWTGVTLPVRPGARLLLALVGDWTLSQQLLQQVALDLAAVLRRLPVSTRTTADRPLRAAYVLARRLARTSDVPEMHQIIVDAAARAVNAEKASLAVYDPEQRWLVITATHGYPAVLVKHVRVRPGAAVIGRVFASGRPMRVTDVRRFDSAPSPRLRYRTSSFLAVPLMGAAGVLGVLSLTDRREAERFDRDDVRALRALASVASLALDRAQAVDRAALSARAAATDEVTGLFNRRHFQTRLTEEVERARRQSSPLTLLMLDVDNFKQFNDRLGHLAGDALLRMVGDLLRRSVRVFDICARYGGDEFAILMPGSGAESSRQIAERIRDGFERERPPLGAWPEGLAVTISIGLAAFAGTTAEDLIARTDRALYAAKREGKNRIGVAGPADSEGS